MVLVTGGAGFIGLNVVEQLVARGDDVAVVDLAAPKAPGAVFHSGDTTDVARLDEIFEKVRPRAVMHLAAITA
ncbi:MAG TPA: NAD-dependent epimerase/dehydratase family protein, partial [Reyranellaceae bacterium]|nr:NAD-dependent epimerase/dehydratase family protein [Reyranellaceae bacterium]